MLVVAFFGSAIIAGVRQYRQEQKPPKELRSYKEIYDWYNKQGKDISPEADGQSGQNELQHEVLNYIDSCLKSGKKIEAIKIYKENYGCNLAEVKRAIEKKIRLIELHAKYENGGKEQLRQWRGLSSCTEDYDKKEVSDVSQIDGMDGHEFEYFCAELLSKNGFSEVKVTPGSGDQGVDVLAEKGGVKYAIQCKNYASPLPNTPVQEVNAGKIFYNCHVGVVMTNSTFTPGAVTLAKATGVLLWGRAVMQEMMRNQNNE